MAQTGGGLLTNIPVVGNLAGGGTFEGTLSLTNLKFVNGQLVASGTLTGEATQGGVVTEITQNFTDVALGLLQNNQQGKCDILFLEIGPIHLDLLGLVVDISQITIDIDAQRGPGKLLGNLLCALAGLLDQNGPLGAIGRLLDQINRLLG